jgi:hypothetical protein
MVVLALITPLLMMGAGTANIRFPLLYLSLLSLGPPFLYFVAQASLHPQRWKKNYRAMPLLILLGSGIALSNTKAVLEALLGVGIVFRRTPKFNVNDTTDRWQNSIYRLPFEGLALGELALGLYSLMGAWFAAVNGHMFAVPFILLYAFGFGYVGLLGMWDARRELPHLFGVGRGAAQAVGRRGGKRSKVKGTNSVRSLNVNR